MRKLNLGEIDKFKVRARKGQGQEPTPRLLWAQPPDPSLPTAVLPQWTGNRIGQHS